MQRLSDQLFPSSLVILVRTDLLFVGADHHFGPTMLDELIDVAEDLVSRSFAPFEVVKILASNLFRNSLMVQSPGSTFRNLRPALATRPATLAAVPVNAGKAA